MRGMIAAAGCVWAIVLWSAAFAAEEPDGSLLDEISHRLEQSYSGVRCLAMEFEQINSLEDMPDGGDVSKGRLWAAGGNRLRMEYSEPKGHLLVCDGTRVWVYVPENKQAVVDSLETGEYAALGKMVMDLLGRGDAEVVGREKLEGADCYVVDVTNIEEPHGLASVRIWVDRGAWLAKGLRLTDLNGNVTTFIFSKVKRLGKVDEERFTFEAPPGVEIVENPVGSGGRR